MKNKTTKSLGINLLMINSFVYISFSVYAPFLSYYYTEKGINAVQVGILLAIAPIIAILIQPLWAMLSDKTGRRKDILALVVFGSGLAVLTYYIGNSFFIFFLASTILALFTTAIVPLSDTIIIKNVKKYNYDFSRIRMGGTIGFSVTVILAGGYIKQNPSAQFLLGFITYIILLLFILKLPRDENADQINSSDQKLNKKVKEKKTKIFQTKKIYFVLALALIGQTGISFYAGFMGVYLLDIGYTQNTLGIVSSLAALSEIPVLLFANKLMRKFGAIKIITVSCLIMVLRLFIITGGNLSFVIVGQLLHGVTYMTIYYSCALYISKNVSPEKQSQGQSILAIIQAGFGSIIGSIFGGYLVDSLGLKNAYFTMAILILFSSLITLAVFMLYLRRERPNGIPA